MDEMDRSKMKAETLAVPPRRPVWLRAATTPFVQAPAFVLERLVSRRGLMLIFFVSAGWLALSGWIRPPLSSDISGAQLPLGAWAGAWDLTETLNGTLPPEQLAVKVTGEPSAGEILHGPRRILADSVGVLLLATIVVGAAVALCFPRRFGTVAGLLLSVAICANAATVLNHPGLTYLLDLEAEQRAQISRLYSVSYDGSMTSVLNDRTRGKPSQLSSAGFLTAVSQSETVPGVTSVVPFLPPIEEERGGWERGLLYVLRGPHLIILLLFGLIVGSRGPLGRRLLFGALFVVLGAVLTVPVCSQRLRAEWDWQQAKMLEAHCDYEGARQALSSCCAVCPAFATRGQTSLLVGKMDEAEGKPTPSRQFFRAFQAYRGKPRSGATTLVQDLPDWPTTQAQDSRECRWAVAVMDDVLREKKVCHEAAATQAADFWMETGLKYYLQKPVFSEFAFRYLDRERDMTATQDAWRRGLELSPDHRDALLCEGLVLARTDPDHPDRAGALFQEVLSDLADRPLKADVLSTLGDSYMGAGLFRESLPFYMQSCDAYTLPKIVNHRGLRGLGGW